MTKCGMSKCVMRQCCIRHTSRGVPQWTRLPVSHDLTTPCSWENIERLAAASRHRHRTTVAEEAARMDSEAKKVQLHCYVLYDATNNCTTCIDSIAGGMRNSPWHQLKQVVYSPDARLKYRCRNARNRCTLWSLKFHFSLLFDSRRS